MKRLRVRKEKTTVPILAGAQGHKQFQADPGMAAARLSRMNDVGTTYLAARRREAGIFLRSRRARLTPAEVGLPNGFRRRTPGLRREEVAMLAGVGTTWYTWLEQGRDVHPSAEVLATLADALRLDAAERRHLFVLNDRPLPPALATEPQQVDPSLRRTLDSLTGQPALVIGRRWDLLAWNAAADATFGPYERLEGDERNMLHLVFADPEHRRLLVDWERVAKNAIAMFRADCARYVGDANFGRLVERLNRLSPEFARWWPKHEVVEPLAGRKRLNHPIAGPMSFEYSSFGVGAEPEMKLIVFTPLEEDGTAHKLAGLLRESVRARRMETPHGDRQTV
jgi:transcriptional regulator with XRE-family HTH domain